MKKETKNWLDSAQYDPDTAEAMLSSKRYVYVVFFCHLALEKALKSVVAETLDTVLPKTHDLLLLARKAKLQLPVGHFDYVSRLNNASVATRYDVDLAKVNIAYPASVATEYLKAAKGAVKWITSRLG